MRNNFVRRLSDIAVGKNSDIPIKPEITPDSLQSFFYPHKNYDTYTKPQSPSFAQPQELSDTDFSIREREISDVDNTKPNLKEHSKESGRISDGILDKTVVDDNDSKMENVVTKRSKFSHMPTKSEPSFDIENAKDVQAKKSKESIPNNDDKVDKTSDTMLSPKIRRIPENVKDKPQNTVKIRDQVGQMYDTMTKPQSISVPPKDQMQNDPPYKREKVGLVSSKTIPSPRFVIQDKTSQNAPKSETMRMSRNSKAQRDLETTVTINIGRIDVHAIIPRKPSEQKQSSSILSLKDYLQGRLNENK